MIDAQRIVDGEFNSDNTENMCFPTISIKKLVTLSILTLGFYNIIWSYNVWKTIKVNFGYKHITVILRALFLAITNFSLFDILNKYIKKHNGASFRPILFAILFIVVNMLSSLRFPICLIALFSVYFIATVQDRINEINKMHFPNAPVYNWTYANTFWAVFLGLWFVVILL